jgi:hypothetical protein
MTLFCRPNRGEGEPDDNGENVSVILDKFSCIIGEEPDLESNPALFISYEKVFIFNECGGDGDCISLECVSGDESNGFVYIESLDLGDPYALIGDAALFLKLDPERDVSLKAASSEGTEATKLPKDGIGNHEFCDSGPSIVVCILFRGDEFLCEDDCTL